MTGKAKKKTKKEKGVLIENKKVRAKYEIGERLEAGIVLSGGEVKSVRKGEVSLGEAWIGVEKEEMWLKKAHIAKWKFDATKDFDPIKDRKLLLHKDEIRRLEAKVKEKGLTLLPLNIHEKRGKMKVEVALGKGLKKFEKRARLKERDVKLDMERQMRGKVG